MQLYRYRCADGREPFSEWLNSLNDRLAQARVRQRLRQLEAGNFGDVRTLAGGVMELRVHIGPGYRIYCARYGPDIVVLLAGGNKSSQQDDIRIAKQYWSEWKKLP